MGFRGSPVQIRPSRLAQVIAPAAVTLPGLFTSEREQTRTVGPGDRSRCERCQGERHPAFKGPMTLYELRRTPDGVAVVLTSSNARAGVPSAKKRFPVPNRTG